VVSTGSGPVTDFLILLTFVPARTTLRNESPFELLVRGMRFVESVVERLPSIGILLLERIDPEAAARCWQILVERREWETLIRQER
jgi:hypothetical protein